MNRKFHIEILGCPKAVYDSETIAGILTDKGFELVSHTEKRDWTIIFTCGFLRKAREESDGAIRTFLKDKLSGKIIVIGCYSQLFYDELKKKFPEVYAFSGVNDYEKIFRIIEGETIISKGRRKKKEDFAKAILTGNYWDYVKISEGCSHSCSFCIIPKIRGDYISRSEKSIKYELELLNESGIEEIVLVSQDTSFFGLDKGKQRLLNLLDEIEKRYDFQWIRVMYLNPMHITDDILKRIGEGNVLPYFDIPFQHSSEKILRLMKRGGSGKDFINIIEKIRKYHPQSFIRSTLITGFPGEEKKDYELLKEFIKTAEIDHLGIFSYSDEKLAQSHDLKNKVPYSISNKRKEELYEIQNEIFNKKLKQLIGKSFDMIFEHRIDFRSIIGRLWFQAPEGIDGSAITRVSAMKIKKPIFKVKIRDFDFENMSYIAE